MIIITDKTLVIPVGIAPNYAGAGNADVKLQAKSVTITENGSKTLFPDSNYNGFSQVNITTNVANNPVLEDKNVEIIENGDYSFIPGPTYDGIGNFRLKVNVETHDPIQVQPVKTAYPSFENDVTVVPSDGYEAMSSVIVKKAEPNLQDKTVAKASTSEIVLRADAGYQGLGTVTVAPIKTKTVSADPSTNVQEFSANTEVNEYITNVTVNPVNTTSINVDPSTNIQTVNATENTYISTVTVNPVGTKTVTLDPSTNSQVVNANVEGNEYITTVTVNPVGTKTVTVDPSTNSQNVNANVERNEYITSVTVNPVTSNIDSNIVPENIAKGVSILGVDGTLEQSSSDTTLIKGTGAPYSAKLKVYQVYLEDKNDSLYGAYNVDVYLRSGDAGTSGYIPFFLKNVRAGSVVPESIASKLGTLEERGITAVVVNGVIYENPTSFNIPYTKVNDGSTNYDDVNVDVYIDFEKANARAEFIENGNITGTDQNFDVNTYKYLPPIFNGNNYEYFNVSRDITIFETVETYVRQPVNALSKYFLTPTYGTDSINIGNMTFLLGEDGIKRVPDGFSSAYQVAKFNNVTFYGNVNNYKNIQFWFDDNNYNTVVYGNVNGFDQTKQLPESSKSTNFFGNVNTPIGYYDEYRTQFMGVDSSICDFSENITANAYNWKGNDIKADVVIMPKTLNNLYDNYMYQQGRFRWYFGAKTYVFFSVTPPAMPGEQMPLVKGGSSGFSSCKLTTIYIPAGADYSSILYDVSDLDPQYHDKYLPTIIEFTPVSSTSEINGPGIYGLTDYRGYHSLIEIKPSTQAEQDLQTVATEINNL